MKIRLLIAAALACGVQAAASQDLTDATVAMTSGNWKVLRSADMMTDKTTCTGIYNDDYGVQLSPDRLFISIRGGVQSVTLRFDDSPPERFRVATEMEKKIRSIIISGSDFTRLRSAQRLRYQSGTLVSGVQNGEINLTGSAAAYESITQGCPVETSTSPTPPQQTSKAGSCEPGLIRKMKDQGLTPEQILAICS